jgi:molybdopterin synthase sulfur carrier subunit
LETRYPGLRDRLCDNDELRPGIAVAVDGHVTSRGLLQKVQPTSEVHFLPAIGGG